jgi:hypothetical protein
VALRSWQNAEGEKTSGEVGKSISLRNVQVNGDVRVRLWKETQACERISQTAVKDRLREGDGPQASKSRRYILRNVSKRRNDIGVLR